MEENYSNENEKEGDSINKTEIKDTYRKVSSGGTVLSSGTMSLNETVLLGTNKNVAETKESGDHKTGGIDYLGGNNKNTSVMPAEGHYDEVDISGRFKNHTMVMMLHNYCKKSVAKTEKINVNNATAYYVDRKKPEGLKHTKTYKYQKGYRKVEIAGCLNLSYAIKDGFILASRRNSQGQNSELTMAENSDIIDKGEPQKDDMSTQLLKNNLPDGTENGDEQGVSGFVNEGNYKGVCKGDNNDTANLTRGDNLDNNKPIISDTQTQESHTLEHKSPSKCKFCKRWFKDRSYFYVHKWSHIAKSQNLRFKCSICSHEFKTISKINSHFKVSHSGIKPYLCKFCGKSFSHKGSFNRHSNTCTHKCTKEKESIDVNNATTSDADIRPYLCNFCGKRFNNGGNFYRHSNACSHKCTKEKESIDVNNATAYDVDGEIPEGLKHIKTYKYKKGYRIVDLVSCLNLSYAIKDGFILASRRNSQGQNSELTMAENSDIIDKGEPQKDDMSTQLLKNNLPDGTENGDEQGVSGFVNEGNYEGVCKGDNNDTANMTRGDNLDNNKPIISDTQTQESQTSEHEHPLRCGFCNKSFKDRSYFYVHKWSHIAKSQNLRIKCSVCSREFNTIPRMNSHFKISHSDIKPYLCNFCGKRFSNRRHFYRHSNTYTQKCTKVKESIDVNATASDADTGPYLCHFCGKMFIHKRSFKRHSNTCSHKYTKEKESIDVNNATTSDVDIRPYLCNFCDKSFNYKGNFYRHCNACSHKYTKEKESIDVNNATASDVDREIPEGLKHIKTYKYKKGYRIVDLASCLNLSYAIKDGFILASRRNSQGQNSELTMAENSDIIDKGEPQKDDMSTQLLKNNLPDGTENGDGQGVSGFVNEGNYEGVCKGDNNDTANLTRGDNLDNNKPIISDTQTQESHTSEHEHPSKCKFCNKWFKDRSYFYVHKWSHIAKSQNLHFKCSICSHEFKTIPRMNSHFKVSHSDIKPYLCKFCGKSFSHKGSFDCHTNTHTKDIKYLANTVTKILLKNPS
ncbi:hypothetical protein KUTeg_006378 [Tegillarca granosa]|uniref:C2H2-type domain-containing protein n=1 Tax=Tegillarca granosa TaxID=220873 RepID=A0ABQ9FGE8_TEGGR|nr:hypothetical protein KUTeg_006378 [Tegillarca granosa]